MYDAIIVGGSFAGLAVAMQLRGYRVLLIDQHPIGARQMSACGTPLATIRAVGAERAIQEVHDTFVLHIGGRTIRLPLPDPYVTFDYRAFCAAMMARTDAEVRLERATALSAGAVTTNRGQEHARFVVDATGWRALHAAGEAPARHAGYGVETELPVHLNIDPGLHFYVEKRIVRSGYAWIFPCGATTRFGVGTFQQGARLAPLLAQFLERFGLRPGATHGGVLAIELREPIAGDVFVAGDAAGQCLPMSGEGIRTAIFHGVHCGQAIAAALRGAISDTQAGARYHEQVRSMERFHRLLLTLQTLVIYTPELLLAAVGRACMHPALAHRILRAYLTGSGWFLGCTSPLAWPQAPLPASSS